MHIDQLPSEVLVMVLNMVPDDQILQCEYVCTRWRNVMIDEKLYTKKCETLKKSHPGLIPTFAHHKFNSDIKGDHAASKLFYFQLKKLKPWNVSKTSDHPKISNFECKTGEVPEEWIRSHNYTGLYDMVWLPDKSYLICSCYDTIQVWDMINYERLNVFEASTLDSKNEKATCFYGCGPALVTGNK